MAFLDAKIVVKLPQWRETYVSVWFVQSCMAPEFALGEDHVKVRASTRYIRILGSALGATLLAVAWGAPAGAANWFEKSAYLIGPRYHAQLPACDTAFAIFKIQSRFATKERRFWNSDLHIVNIEDIREVAFRPWAEGTIPRRFCSGRALISDGQRRQVRYSIIEDSGVMGVSWGVQWCVVGIDRNWAYNPNCNAAGP